MQSRKLVRLFWTLVLVMGVAGCAGSQVPINGTSSGPTPPPDGTFAIEGTLTHRKGAVEGAFVMLLTEWADGWKPYRQGTNTDPQGKFRLIGLADGEKRYQLVIYSNPHAIKYPQDSSLFQVRPEPKMSEDGSSFQPSSGQRIPLTATLPAENGEPPLEGGGDSVALGAVGDRGTIVKALNSGTLPERLKEGLEEKGIAFHGAITVVTGKEESGWLVLDSEKMYRLQIDTSKIAIERYHLPTPPPPGRGGIVSDIPVRKINAN